MKAIRLTRHARNRMRWHQISEDLIHATLQAADWEAPDRIVVISAVFKRRPPGRRGQA